MPTPKQRAQLIAALPALTEIIRGSLVPYYHEGCPCHPKGRYGPYWRLSVNQGGRTRMRHVPLRKVPAIRQAIKNYQRWWATSLRIFEANTQLLLTQEDQGHARSR